MGPTPITVYQGIVASVEGITCTVSFGDQDVSGVRLRASEAENDAQILLVPRVGTAVIVGSLSGDLSQLAVLSVDAVERIEINGGKLGGLVNIEALTAKINELVDAFNAHTHIIGSGSVIVGVPSAPMVNYNPIVVPKVLAPASRLSRKDYEDTTIEH
ncbi:MAG: hypothetical protein IJK29_05645 [Bacteroidales bacterium]|nr:hypothetical protein [Bacteroidales bacterium]